MKALMLVAAGGALGSALRYGVQQHFNASFPNGTLAVNILGCFFIGMLWSVLRAGEESKRLFLMTGFCGGFTTFSAFTMESILLLQSNRWLSFFFYTTASMGLGLIATFAGIKLFST